MGIEVRHLQTLDLVLVKFNTNLPEISSTPTELLAKKNETVGRRNDLFDGWEDSNVRYT